MKGIINGFFTCLSLVSRFKVRQTKTPDFTWIGFSLPIIGLLVGGLSFLFFFFGYRLFLNLWITAVVTLIVQYYLFNLFHFDGLIDSADAFSTMGDKEKVLAILKDVHVGAFGLFAGIMYIVLKVILLQSNLTILVPLTLEKGAYFVFLFTYPAAGRIAATLIPLFLRNARSSGLGVLLKDFRRLKALSGVFIAVLLPLIVGLIIASGVNTPVFLSLALLSLVSALLTLLFWGRLYERRAGGYTGDTLGAAVETGELLHLLLFLIILRFLQ